MNSHTWAQLAQHTHTHTHTDSIHLYPPQSMMKLNPSNHFLWVDFLCPDPLHHLSGKKIGKDEGRNWKPEKAMAPHSTTLTWKIPWTEESGRLPSVGSLESDTTE